MAVSAVYPPRVRASAAAAVFGCYAPRVVVAAAAVDEYPLLGVAFQRPDSRGLDGAVAEPSPWKRINFRRVMVISSSLRLCVTSGSPSSTFSNVSPVEESGGGRGRFSVSSCRSHTQASLGLVCVAAWHRSRPSTAQRAGGGFLDCICVGDLCGAGRAGPRVLGKPSIAQCWSERRRKDILTLIFSRVWKKT